MGRPALEARSLAKAFPAREGRVEALREATLDVQPGEVHVILGVSGSGKTTLLHCLGLIERPDAGVLRIEGQELQTAPEAELAAWRNRRIGFVFQSFHLVPELTALENVMLPGMMGGRSGRALREEAGDLLEAVGLSNRAGHRPGQLSGGERQRVAVARALVNRPAVVLADEPTGNLDRRTGGQVVDILVSRARAGSALVIVTHNEDLARLADRVHRMVDGRLEDAACPS